MVFSSTVFLLAFLPVTIAVYFLVPQRYIQAKNVVLLAASLFFYGWGEPKYILVMLGSIAFNYVTARLMAAGRRARLWLIVCVVGNLLILGIFKYAGFVADTVASLLGSGFGLLSIALPIGISFYTFQTMSYVIDVYRGKVAVQKNLIIFACYVTLFPQLIAGPIVRYSDVEVQLKRRTTTAAQLAEGVRRFTIGFAKKVLLANQVYVIWKELSAMQTLSVGAAWLGAVAFTFQIYFDFSGYSDMAIGLGKVFGFDYLENFDYPYISRSITEFWRRWHMSLSSWFKEYVYIPLGGNRKGLRRQIFNIALVWALTGLWHGASWNFVVWGVYYGALLIIEKLWLLKRLNRAPAAVGHIYSMLTVIIGWVIFAEENFGEMGRYLSMLFGAGGCLTDDAFFYYLGTRAVLLAVCVLAATPFPAKLGRAILCRAERLDRTTLLQGLLESASMLAVLCLSMAFLVSGSYNPFLYFRF